GIPWVLAIVLLTWTLKAIMVKPTLISLRSQRKMQELQPRLQEVRTKYANDKTKQAEEMQKVYKDAKMRPMAGCLPMLAQVPMFIGLFHVLRSLDRTGSLAGRIGHPAGEPMSLKMNRSIGNYFFKPDQVQSYLDTDIFGVPLVANLRLNSPILHDVTTAQA